MAIVFLMMRSDLFHLVPEQQVMNVGSLNCGELTLQTKSHSD